MRRTLITAIMAVAMVFSAISAATADNPTGGDAAITSPTSGTFVLADSVRLSATYEGTSDNLNWAVRIASCEAGGSNMVAVGPNVTDDTDDVMSWSYTEDSGVWYFDAVVDVSAWSDGEYCFIFNPATTSDAHRATVAFYVAKDLRTKDACKDGGWQTFGDYKNQGECVSSFAADEHAGK